MGKTCIQRETECHPKSKPTCFSKPRPLASTSALQGAILEEETESQAKKKGAADTFADQEAIKGGNFLEKGEISESAYSVKNIRHEAHS